MYFFFFNYYLKIRSLIFLFLINYYFNIKININIKKIVLNKICFIFENIFIKKEKTNEHSCH